MLTDLQNTLKQRIRKSATALFACLIACAAINPLMAAAQSLRLSRPGEQPVQPQSGSSKALTAGVTQYEEAAGAQSSGLVGNTSNWGLQQGTAQNGALNGNVNGAGLRGNINDGTLMGGARGGAMPANATSNAMNAKRQSGKSKSRHRRTN